LICYNGPDEGELSTKMILSILDELVAEGCLFLTITGGEPFIRSDIYEILKYAVKKGFAVTLKTNGTLINSILAKKISDMNLFEINISLFGATAGVHDNMTGLKGSFEKALNAIKSFKENGANIKVMSVIAHGNTEEIQKIEQLCEEIGVEVVFDSVVSDGKNEKAINYRLSDDELRKYFSYLKTAPLPDCKKMEEELTEEEKSNDLLLTCGAGRSTVNITPNGMVTPCIGIPLEIGSLRDNSLREIMDSNVMKGLIESIRLKNVDDCWNCSDRLVCFRCPGLSYSEKGRLDVAPEEGCRQMKIKREILNEEKEKNI
jgi:radical SAM protein with 4Fe4S-binding SPASM domain